VKEFIDITAEKDGTPVNRNTMMALQGFISKTIVRNDDGSITETNADGETLTTVKNADGSVTQVFTGEKTITKTTRITEDNTILEEVIE
jgi:archaeosine-15-forming tRNA-guanine transglycosylase